MEWKTILKIMSKGIYKRTKKHKDKISKANSIAQIGNKNALGHSYLCTKEIKEKIRIGQKKCWKNPERRKRGTGKNAANWRGGISFEPYSINWTQTLKRSIRERDKYTCQICSKNPAIQVHHIDYDKKNCNPDNLITLCKGCHSKTSFNREYWIKYFNYD